MMTQLLEDRYAPITSTIGFLECDAQRAKDYYLDWMRPLQADRGVNLECRQIHGDLVSRLKSLLPLTSVERRRVLFLPTNSAWTAYIDNGWQGTDAYSPVSYLCRVIACRGLRAVSVPDTFQKTANGAHGRYGATIFELYAPTTEGCSFLNTQRSIFAANDGGPWKFSADGQPLEFEDLKQYAVSRIKDRFTPEMLDRYLRALGISFFSPDFYEVPKPAHLVSKEGPSAPAMKTYSLEEARAGY
jgi:hypothetical protein